MGKDIVVETIDDLHAVNLTDQRENQSIHESEFLQSRLLKDCATKNWLDIQLLFGDYGTKSDPTAFLVKLIDGNLVGQAEVVLTDQSQQTEIRLAMPSEAGAVIFFQSEFRKAGYDFDENTCREIFYAVQSQTVFHEGIHLLLSSQPGSLLAKTVEATGFSNENNCHATLIDEGITYALQDYFAPEIDGLGTLEYRVNPDSKKTIDLRKQLGKLIRPIIQELIAEKKKFDETFLHRAINQLSKVVSFDWVPEEADQVST